MMRPSVLLTSVLMLFGLSPAFAETREIALTFDDAPREDTPLLKTGAERDRLLLQNLRAAVVPRVFFYLVPGRITPANEPRIKAFMDDGHYLGNHTFTHPDLNVTDLTDYLTDIRLAHEALQKMKFSVPYFRFPMLREGDTKVKRDAVRAELARLHLMNGYVTVNTYDWSLDQQVQQALRDGKTVDRKALGKTYVEMLVSDVEHYDALAKKLLKRSPKHVLLLHENDVAALYIGDLVQALRVRGWKIIAPEIAYRDPISRYQATTISKYNPGRIGEIARDLNQYSSELWSPYCDEGAIEALLKKNKVFSPGPMPAP